jgi:hypothetical protein
MVVPPHRHRALLVGCARFVPQDAAIADATCSDGGTVKIGASRSELTSAQLATAQFSTNALRRLLRLGWRSLRSALASIWRMRSRVTSKSWPTSSSV